MKLLLHTCCAPCSVFCIDTLKKENIDITSYWYNPNIHPYEEYMLRLNSLKKYNNTINVPLIVDDYYGLRDFVKNVVDNIDNRCVYCYKSRLEKTAKYAKENGYDAFSTTLLYSIYQNHELIKSICEKLEKRYDIKFLYRDFRVGFWVGQQKAREIGLYMQKYCGCIFSEDKTTCINVKPKLPDDFQFIKAPKDIIIKKDKKEDNKDSFVLTYKDEIICTATVKIIDNDICILNDIKVKEEYQNMGYGSKMIKYLFDNYKNKYNKIIVKAFESNTIFFIKQGFDKYEKTENGYMYYSKLLK